MDHYGRLDDDIAAGLELASAASMMSPVRCAYCSRIYDLGSVEVTARYADCSVWKSPCCGITVDDRGETGWKSKKDYYRVKVAS